MPDKKSYRDQRIDKLIEIIDTNNVGIEEWNEEVLRNKISDEVEQILNSIDTEIERENKLRELIESSRETFKRYYIGAYSCSEVEKQDKIRSLLKAAEQNFGMQIPDSFKSRNEFVYHEKAWYDLFKELLDSIVKRLSDNTTFKDLIYGRATVGLVNMNKLNAYCFISLRARLRVEYLEDYFIKNAAHLKKTETALELKTRWKKNRDEERFKLLEFYETWMESSSSDAKFVIEMMFKDLKKRLGFNMLSDIEAGKKIKKITDLTFIDEYGQIKSTIAKSMSDARKARNKSS